MNKLYIAIMLAFSLFVAVSCSDNLFGSGGSANDCEKDIKCWRTKAENEFRSSRYEDAYKSYEKIVNLDSTASVGYFGMAKSGLWMKQVNPFDVFRFYTIEEDSIPFMQDSVRIQNKYLQGMKYAANSLKELQRRDSLTALYEIHKKDSLGQDVGGDSLLNLLNLFRKDFCKTGLCQDKGGKLFPISDREFKYNSYSGGFFISTTAKALLEPLDNNRNGCIARRGYGNNPDNSINTVIDPTKWKEWGCDDYKYDLSISLKKDSAGNFIIDLDQILKESEEILNEHYKCMEDFPKNPEKCDIPGEIDGLNKSLEDLVGNLEEVIDILDGFGVDSKVCQGELAGGEDCEETSNKWKDEINKYKDYTSFYRIGTHIDEDGDGCIDEDLLNGMDNDGDGLRSTNARLAPNDSSKDNWGRTNMMGYHSMTGDSYWDEPIRALMPRICNDADCNKISTLHPPAEYGSDSVTIIRFATREGYWTSDDLELKLAVAQDTVCGELQYSLDDRQRLVGGCWPDYDQEEFIKYWLKRELASPSDRTRRVHENCKKCEGDACVKKAPATTVKTFKTKIEIKKRKE